MNATATNPDTGKLESLLGAYRACSLEWNSFQLEPPKDLGLNDQERKALHGLSVENSQILIFALSPVQEFIEASKSLRDLWASSLILSNLVDHVMTAIRSKNGFIVYPRPFEKKTDVTAVDASNTSPRSDKGQARSGEIASTPHRFFAVVPTLANLDGQGNSDWPSFCKNVFQEIWTRQFAGKVSEYMIKELRNINGIWERCSVQQFEQRWRKQTETFWETRCLTLPLSPSQVPDDQAGRMLGGLFFSDRFSELHLLRQAAKEFAGIQDETDTSTQLGRWQVLTQLAQRLLGAMHPVRQPNRFFPVEVPSNLSQKTPDKCQMFGSYEVMGPDSYAAQMEFWSKLQKVSSLYLKPGERFSAIGLIKRLLPHCQKWEKPVFADSASIAAALWLKTELVSSQDVDQCATVREFLCQDQPEVSQVDWRWLHWAKIPEKEDTDHSLKQDFQAFRQRFWELTQAGISKPPVYYAALLMDADHCHRRLSGKSLPSMGRELEGKMIMQEDYRASVEQLRLESPWFERNWDFVQGCRRPLTPAYHVDLSRRQSRFGAEVVPSIIDNHFGQVIYNGGDEFLALLPISDVFQAAAEIRSHFSKHEYFGPDASMSAGIMLAHYKTDLRLVLQETRRSLQLAKQLGRNLSTVSVLTSSGQSKTALCPWPYMSELARYIQAFSHENIEGKPTKAASDRWLYQILEQWDLLKTFNQESNDQLHPAISQILRKRVAHAETATCTRLRDCLRQLPQHQWGLAEFPTHAEQAGELICRSAENYVSLVTPRLRQQSWLPTILAFEHYLNLVWIASFCTRGGVA